MRFGLHQLVPALAGTAVLFSVPSLSHGDLVGTPSTTISRYTGGDAIDGLALSGTYVQTVNIGKTTPGNVTLQGYEFVPLSAEQPAPGAAIAGNSFDYANFQNTNYNPPRPFDYGSSQDDDAMETIMGQVAFGNAFSSPPYTRNLGIGFTTMPGTTYELQLLIPNVDNFRLDFEVFLEAVSLGQFSTNNLDPTGNHDGTILTSVFTIDEPNGSNLDINVFQLNTSESLVTVGAATLKVVPEPASLSLLALGGLAALRRRARA